MESPLLMFLRFKKRPRCSEPSPSQSWADRLGADEESSMSINLKCFSSPGFSFLVFFFYVGPYLRAFGGLFFVFSWVLKQIQSREKFSGVLVRRTLDNITLFWCWCWVFALEIYGQYMPGSEIPNLHQGKLKSLGVPFFILQTNRKGWAFWLLIAAPSIWRKIPFITVLHVEYFSERR